MFAFQSLLVAINTLTPLMLFLGLQAQSGNWPRVKPLKTDRLASLLAITVCALLDALERRIDFRNQLTLAITGPQLKCTVRF